MNAISLIYLFWVILLLYWGVFAFSVKRDMRLAQSWQSRLGLVLFFFIMMFALASLLYFQKIFSSLQTATASHATWLSITGVVLCGLGVAFAIWARFYLGKNWSGTPSLKEGHELIVGGPYRLVRHPIYTGMLLALLGSALVGGFLWFIIFISSAALLLYRIKIEERLMAAQFPAQYLEYKKKTKSLIPFIF